MKQGILYSIKKESIQIYNLHGYERAQFDPNRHQLLRSASNEPLNEYTVTNEVLPVHHFRQVNPDKEGWLCIDPELVEILGSVVAQNMQAQVRELAKANLDYESRLSVLANSEVHHRRRANQLEQLYFNEVNLRECNEKFNTLPWYLRLYHFIKEGMYK